MIEQCLSCQLVVVVIQYGFIEVEAVAAFIAQINLVFSIQPDPSQLGLDHEDFVRFFDFVEDSPDVVIVNKLGLKIRMKTRSPLCRYDRYDHRKEKSRTQYSR